MSQSGGAEARLKGVDEHIAHEVAHRLEPLVETFGDEPEWHNKPRGNSCTVTAIRDFCAALFEGFPDFDLDVREKHVASDAGIVEAEIRGTHRGSWMGVAATGKTVCPLGCGY